MRKSLVLGALMTILLGMSLYAQELKVTWSDNQQYSNKTDGYFDYFVGVNSKYIYAKFTNAARHRNQKPRLVSFDKKSMAKVGTVELLDLTKDPKAQYDDLEYYKTVIFDNILYVFWTNDMRGKKELYVESFDAELSPLNPLKKIYELKYDTKNKKKPDFFVLYNMKITDHLVIGGELAGDKQQNVKVEYKLLNSDFSFAASNRVELPVVTISKSRGLTSAYEYGEDGNIHITSFVTLDKEQRKLLSKGESYRFSILSLVEPTSGKIKSHTLKFDNKNILKSGYKIDKGVTKVYAFFCDLEKDPSGKATHGILYGTLNNQTLDVENVNFSYFTKAQLDKLYANDKEDQKKVKAPRGKKKGDDGESIQSDYVVEDTQSVDDDLVLFCSRMRNYEVTTCDSKGNCHTSYYCEKRNVTAFRLGKDGKLVWASNMDRKITYGGWDIEDVNTIHTKDKFYVSYGSQFQKEAEKKNRAAKKSRAQMSDHFEYAIFDMETGNYKKLEYKVNADNAKKADKKTIEPRLIRVFDNVFYTNSSRIKIVLWPVIAGAVLEVTGAGLIFFDIVMGRNNDQLRQEQMNNNANIMANYQANNPGPGYPPPTLEPVNPPTNHTKLYVGIAMEATGITLMTIIRNKLKGGSGYLGRIEPAK